MEAAIEVQLASGHGDEPTVEQVRKWVAAALAVFHVASASLTVRMVDETEMIELNTRFRAHPGPTNVLSFPVGPLPGLPKAEHPLGDIVVCPSVVEREALSQGKKVQDHFAHLVVHGVLHLHGHDHQNNSQAAAMEQLETEVLATLGIENPYQTA
ncbi:MAG TPA: rRNA maturation RNase YbeY [Gammaproteobacteria bacterium]|nr:rRNA maturation RNase YbeY [Gammaproteobacteria bacterium]